MRLPPNYPAVSALAWGSDVFARGRFVRRGIKGEMRYGDDKSVGIHLIGRRSLDEDAYLLVHGAPLEICV